MPSDGIVEPLDVVEHVCAGLVAGAVGPSPDALGLERGEEALHRRVVPDVSRAAHGACDAMIGHQALEGLAGILAALIRVVQQLLRSTSAPDRHPLPGRASRSDVPRGIRASVTIWAVMSSFMDQPTTRLENRSMTTAT